MAPPRVSATQEMLREFCQRHHIRRLALFGSVLRDDFSPQSDIDVIAAFEPGEPVGFIRLGTVEAELSDLLGRPVDLNLQDSLDPTFRERVLAEAETLYVAASQPLATWNIHLELGCRRCYHDVIAE